MLQNKNNHFEARMSIGKQNYYVAEYGQDQALEYAAKLQQETDAKIASRKAIGMTLFALGGGANLIPLTGVMAAEVTIGATEIADNHKTRILGNTAVSSLNKP